jgi:hypothetical protein
MKQAPLWLPCRVRERIDQARITNTVRAVDRTRPYHAADPQSADAELHMLLCKRDVRLGVLAIKSLLRFGNDRLAVTVTDDGSLSGSHRQWVSRHIPGCRWLSWPTTQNEDLDKALEDRPRLAALYKSDFPLVSKLLHPLVLARCRRIIIMDADTAFFQPPDRLMEWVRGDDTGGWYLHDHQDEDAMVPPEAREGFADLKAALNPHGRQWGLKHWLFNSGLLATCPGTLDLDLAEHYLTWLETISPQYTIGLSGLIWFSRWTQEQTCYHIMCALSEAPYKPLGEDYHIGGDAGHVFNHFLRHYLIRSHSLRMLRELISQL